MCRRWIIAVTLILLAGCTGGLGGPPPAGDETEGTQADFVRQLIEVCAGVNRSLANVTSPKDEPRRVADQLGGFVDKVEEVSTEAARSSPAPEEQDALDRLFSSISDAEAALRRAAEALEAGEGSKADAFVTEQFTEHYNEADKAAMEYGMPHLAECDKSLHSASPNGSATPTAPPSTEQVGWRAGADLSVAVQQLGSAVVDGTIWVAGGLTGDSAAAEVQGYDPAIDTWKSAPPLPIELHHAMAVSYQGRLVVLGGWMPQGGQLPGVESDQVFVLGDEGWTELSRMNHRRVAGAAAVVGDKIVVVGGQADEELVTTTEVFDGSAWIEGADMPTPREHVAAATDGVYLYAVGGRALSSDKNLKTLERYDPEKNQWTRLTQMPTARGGLGAAVVDGRLVAVGGEHSTGVFGTVEAYDIASDTWSTLAELETPRHGLAVAAVGNSLYAIGGATKPSHTSSTPTVEILAFS
jgi:N-acetylneuraminic acid mutarotase